MRDIPEELAGRPFTRAEALGLGVTSRMLEGARFTRVFPGVWRCSDATLTHHQLIDAAGLSLPSTAHVTGITRLQKLGLEFGPRTPLRFVTQGDLHLTPPGIFLHRTKRLAPRDSVGIGPAGAFISYCSLARAIDAIKVGDWLLHRKFLTIVELHDVAWATPWRAGAAESLWVLEHLNAGSRSLKESETRAVLDFSGLEPAEVNVDVDLPDPVRAIGDLVYPRWRTVVEYEGVQHQLERVQYTEDIDRYARFRAAGIAYVQVTAERLANPRLVVGDVYRTLVTNGYDGPPPELGARWSTLFSRVTRTLGSRREYLRRLAAVS